MPLVPPPYFQEIKRRAQDRWNQLESDLELAGPWRLLFQQVQSPRHVVSELLQNADDAGATNVRIAIDEGWFIFEHDGRDFSQAEFESLCRFGFSNKRNLHTIGFRGIGFKSTFSLGVAVEVRSPTIAVRFHQRRFTEPLWIDGADACKATQIRVPVRPDSVDELRRSLDDWRASGSSLLFFRSLRSMDIEGNVIAREILGDGPVPNSQWMAITSNPAHKLLVVRSEPAVFPEDAVKEIRQERNANDITLPPCIIDLVLGLHGDEQLYVVLPTGVRPPVPFSCNAPFLQDPSRHGIKSPSLSPTNRWLLDRIGRLAAQATVAWLGHTPLSREERAAAYSLFPAPRVPQQPTSENQAAEIITQAFSKELGNKPCVLTAAGELAVAGKAMAVPRPLQEDWPADELTAILSRSNESLVAAEVSDVARKRLASWDRIRVVTVEDLISHFARTDVPRPSNLKALATLWALLETECRYPRNTETRKRLRIVPVAGCRDLQPAERVVRLAERASLPTQDDWQFLSQLVNVIDGQWILYLTECQKRAPEDEAAAGAVSMLELVDLDSPTPISQVIRAAGKVLFGRNVIPLADGVRLAHIAAAMGADVSEEFYYATQDEDYRDVNYGVVADPDAAIESLVPVDWSHDHILHGDYFHPSQTCRRDQWLAWVRSSKSGLWGYPPTNEIEENLWGERQLQAFLRARNASPPESFQYATKDSRVYDFDFDKELVTHWQHEETTDPTIWARLLESILRAPAELWADYTLATVYERSRTGNERRAQCDDFSAAWVHRLSTQKCLSDTYGVAHEPAELLMRTPDTEPLMGVELFVKAELDTEHTRPLLKLLGVRDTPSGPHQLLNRIRTLSTVSKPPLQEVVRWYDALDRVLVRSSSEELAEVRQAFQNERLILTQELEWTRSEEAFLAEDEETVPGVAVVHEAARRFAMWSRIGVEPRPTVDRVLEWLNSLDSESLLPPPIAKRVRAVLGRFPRQVWERCGHWLSLEGTWVPIEQLQFRLSMQGLTRYSDLFDTFKRRVADLRVLDVATCEQLPFSTLRPLDGAIEYRVINRQSLRQPERKAWLATLGALLARVEGDDDKTTERIRSLGARLAATGWQTVAALRVSPYIDGTPAGQPAAADALWRETTLYVQDRPFSRLFNPLVQEIARPFNSVPIAEAIRACLGRDDEFIADYFAANFKLAEPPAPQPAPAALQVELVAAAPPSQPSAASIELFSPVPPLPFAETESNEPIEPPLENDPPNDWPSAAEPINPPSPGADSVPELSEESPALEFQVVDSSEAPLPELSLPPAPEEPRARPQPPSLFERFVSAEGFCYDALRGNYVHPEGDWLVRRTSGFNGERYSADGELVCQYWVSDQSLWNGGVEINAELWELLKAQAPQSAVVLRGPDGEPLLLAAVELVRQVAASQVHLFPAKYRLRQPEDSTES